MDKEQGIIYLITNKTNSKKYVGQTKRTLEQRWKDHIYKKKNLIGKAIKKYGANNFKIKVLEKCDINKLNKRERYWIKYYNTFEEKGYNLTPGGESRDVFTDSIRKKLSKKARGKNNNQATISEKTALNIYEDYKENKTNYRILAKKYNVKKSSVGNIVNANHWATRHLEKLKKNINIRTSKTCSKLNEKEVREIIKKYKTTNKTYKDLAKEYNIAKSSIGYIIRGERYKWVDR